MESSKLQDPSVNLQRPVIIVILFHLNTYIPRNKVLKVFLVLSYNSDKKKYIKSSSVRSFHNKQQDKNNNNDNFMRKLV